MYSPGLTRSHSSAGERYGDNVEDAGSIPAAITVVYGVVYLITNTISGKRYVGQALDIDQRWREHKSRARRNATEPLYVAIRKHGIENFIIEVIEKCQTLEELNEREIFWIANYDTFHGRGYNQTLGGGGSHGYRHSEEAKTRIAAAQRGRVRSPETRARMAEAHRKHPPKDASRSTEPRKRRPLSEEHKRQIAEALKGKPKSEEHKRHLSKPKRKGRFAGVENV